MNRLKHKLKRQYKAENDCAAPRTLALCIPADEGPRFTRVLKAKAKLTPLELKEERSCWFEAMLTAHLQDREDYLRPKATR
jgi:hypothetical protein